MTYAIILAGGVGSRFWPLSRKKTPKQFLNICSERPLVDETVRRLLPLVTRGNIYIAANNLHIKKISRCLKGRRILPDNFFFEPYPRNTLAPIAVISHLVCMRDKDAVIAVFPSDHFIREDKKFARLFAEAVKSAKKGRIVTFGIPPARPDTGYGYIKINSKARSRKAKVYKVDKFIEKPDIRKAKRFVNDGRYYWNSGIFIFKAAVLLDELHRFLPLAYKTISRIRAKGDAIKLWSFLPRTSIDYGIMERTDKAFMLAAECGWTDLGSWQAIGEVLRADSSGNIFRGSCLDLGSRNTFVWSQDKFVATVGLEDIAVVNGKDALLVCSKDKAQDVKKLVQLLGKKGLKRYL